MKATYGRAYLVGLLFFVATNAMAINAVFGHLTPQQLSALTRPEVLLLCNKVVALAGVNLLAYFNQNIARADIASSPPVPPKINP